MAKSCIIPETVIGKVVPILHLAPHHKDIWGREGIAPWILNLGPRVVSGYHHISEQWKKL
jgi:hypothetical protein